ncbi:DUF5130 family protein [Nocardia sp. 348MFTsu5.1]|uniref:DUF5130 family protein n=1 Tax=Nocardia sp. 348MFTsu5.1 TaxID=1172185 RepID=UPI000377B015|nr:DUF5130 family protein [Nocardia sp. 348MFTsu5.1]
MASGDVVKSTVDPETLPMGSALTISGRISAARFPTDVPTTPPFKTDELVALDEALADATDETGIRFSVFIGDLGVDAVAGAAAILPNAPEPEHAALIAVSPNTKDVVVVSGKEVAARLNDRVAQLGVTAAIAGIRSGDLVDGLISAIRVIAAAVTVR